MRLAHGKHADIKGRHNKIFNLISSPGFSLNIKTTNSDFYLNKKRLLVHGSFITEAHIVTQNLRVSYYADKIGTPPMAWVNGTCYNKSFKIGAKSLHKCGKENVKTNYSSAFINTYGWDIVITPQPVYNRVSGPLKRLDLKVYKKTNEPSHGIMGQSYENPRDGKTDVYPAEGEFTTTAQAEGALDGTIDMYKVEFAYDTNFKFSMFNKSYYNKKIINPIETNIV